jgi:uncharacterized protein (DUF736 family)
MATIGTFKKTGSNEFTGAIVALSVHAKNVRVVPRDPRRWRERPQPSRLRRPRRDRHRLVEALQRGSDYLGLKLDDPSFTAPILANLFEDEDGEGYSLIWSRPSRRTAE